MCYQIYQVSGELVIWLSKLKTWQGYWICYHCIASFSKLWMNWLKPHNYVVLHGFLTKRTKWCRQWTFQIIRAWRGPILIILISASSICSWFCNWGGFCLHSETTSLFVTLCLSKFQIIKIRLTAFISWTPLTIHFLSSSCKLSTWNPKENTKKLPEIGPQNPDKRQLCFWVDIFNVQRFQLSGSWRIYSNKTHS